MPVLPPHAREPRNKTHGTGDTPLRSLGIISGTRRFGTSISERLKQAAANRAQALATAQRKQRIASINSTAQAYNSDEWNQAFATGDRELVAAMLGAQERHAQKVIQAKKDSGQRYRSYKDNERMLRRTTGAKKLIQNNTGDITLQERFAVGTARYPDMNRTKMKSKFSRGTEHQRKYQNKDLKRTQILTDMQNEGFTGTTHEYAQQKKEQQQQQQREAAQLQRDKYITGNLITSPYLKLKGIETTASDTEIESARNRLWNTYATPENKVARAIRERIQSEQTKESPTYYIHDESQSMSRPLTQEETTNYELGGTLEPVSEINQSYAYSPKVEEALNRISSYNVYDKGANALQESGQSIGSFFTKQGTQLQENIDMLSEKDKNKLFQSFIAFLEAGSPEAIKEKIGTRAGIPNELYTGKPIVTTIHNPLQLYKNIESKAPETLSTIGTAFTAMSEPQYENIVLTPQQRADYKNVASEVLGIHTPNLKDRELHALYEFSKGKELNIKQRNALTDNVDLMVNMKNKGYIPMTQTELKLHSLDPYAESVAPYHLFHWDKEKRDRAINTLRNRKEISRISAEDNVNYKEAAQTLWDENANLQTAGAMGAYTGGLLLLDSTIGKPIKKRFNVQPGTPIDMAVAAPEFLRAWMVPTTTNKVIAGVEAIDLATDFSPGKNLQFNFRKLLKLQQPFKYFRTLPDSKIIGEIQVATHPKTSSRKKGVTSTNWLSVKDLEHHWDNNIAKKADGTPQATFKAKAKTISRIGKEGTIEIEIRPSGGTSLTRTVGKKKERYTVDPYGNVTVRRYKRNKLYDIIKDNVEGKKRKKNKGLVDTSEVTMVSRDVSVDNIPPLYLHDEKGNLIRNVQSNRVTETGILGYVTPKLRMKGTFTTEQGHSVTDKQPPMKLSQQYKNVVHYPLGGATAKVPIGEWSKLSKEISRKFQHKPSEGNKEASVLPGYRSKEGFLPEELGGYYANIHVKVPAMTTSVNKWNRIINPQVVFIRKPTLGERFIKVNRRIGKKGELLLNQRKKTPTLPKDIFNTDFSFPELKYPHSKIRPNTINKLHFGYKVNTNNKIRKGIRSSDKSILDTRLNIKQRPDVLQATDQKVDQAQKIDLAFRSRLRQKTRTKTRLRTRTRTRVRTRTRTRTRTNLKTSTKKKKRGGETGFRVSSHEGKHIGTYKTLKEAQWEMSRAASKGTASNWKKVGVDQGFSFDKGTPFVRKKKKQSNYPIPRYQKNKQGNKMNPAMAGIIYGRL